MEARIYAVVSLRKTRNRLPWTLLFFLKKWFVVYSVLVSKVPMTGSGVNIFRFWRIIWEYMSRDRKHSLQILAERCIYSG